MERKKEMKAMKGQPVQTTNPYTVLSGFKECTYPHPRCSTSCDKQRNA